MRFFSQRYGTRVKNMRRDVALFFCAVVACGFASSIFDAVFNNYLDSAFGLSSLHRAALEIPREIPGLITAGVIAALFLLCSRRLAAFSMLLMAAGLVSMVFLSVSLKLMVVWLFVYSLGQHLFIPLSATLGMELAQDGKPGRRLGQLNGARNCAAITGGFFVFLAFRYLRCTFHAAFIIASAFFLVAAFLIFTMKRGATHPPSVHLKMHKEYRLYYWLSILYGTRKQIFLTFAPWVLVTVFKQPTQMLATLLTVGGVIGVVFQPLLGRAIDRFGERVILAGEACILIFVCLGYASARKLFGPQAALAVTAACFVLDQLLMSVGMARATYIKKIALSPEHVAPALAMSTSIDHAFSISTAVVCGWLWHAFGYEVVFVLGAGIAVVNLFSAMKITIPEKWTNR